MSLEYQILLALCLHSWIFTLAILETKVNLKLNFFLSNSSN